MELVKVPATRRPPAGKGEARRLRASGRVPAVAYGKELGSTPLAVAPKDLSRVLHSEHGKNSVVELTVEGGDKIVALITDYQYHPLSRELLHADFLQIHLDKPVEVKVPFELTGKPKGVVLGGTLRQVFRELPVSCLPEKIPVKIQHDMTEIDIDDHVAVKDLSLPEGVTVRLSELQTVAAVVTERKSGKDEAEAAPAAPGAPGAAAPAAAAPAKS